MKESEITALAREYAEEMIKGKPSEELPNCLKNSMLTMNTEYIAEVFQWLLRRFCLVEKERLKRVLLLHAERSAENGKGGKAWFFHKGSANTLRYLFPDLGKEVEE